MAMDKAIASGKEHRKQYRRLAQQIDASCRCHGGCIYCLNNRTHKYELKKLAMKQREDDFNALH